MSARFFGRKICQILIAIGISHDAFAGDLVWNGYLSTGFGVSKTKYKYQGHVDHRIHPQDRTILGLNLSKILSPEWRITSQIVARSNEADAALKADWIFATYVPNDTYDLTIGRQKIPLWSASAYLDVGHAYVWANPPDEVYSMFLVKSFDGVSGSLKYDLQGALLRFSPIAGEVQVEISPNAPTATSKLIGTNMYGASLEAESENYGIRAAFLRAIWDLNLPGIELGKRDVEILTVGGNAKFGNYFLLSEMATTQDFDQKKYDEKADELDEQAKVAAQNGSTTEAQTLAFKATVNRVRIGEKRGAYVTFGRDFFEKYTLLMTAAALKSNYFKEVTRDQNSLTLGANYTINIYSDIKFEAKHVYLPKNSVGLFSIPILPASEVGELRRTNIYTVSYDVEF